MTVVRQSWFHRPIRIMLASDIGVLWDFGDEVWLTEFTDEDVEAMERAEDWWLETGQYI